MKTNITLSQYNKVLILGLPKIVKSREVRILISYEVKGSVSKGK